MNKKQHIEQYYKNKYKNKLLAVKYIKNREEDVIYKIIDNLSRRARKFLLKNNLNKNMTHMELIGCTPMELKEYLRSKFLSNMDYDNYGEWEIDHIKAISLYDLCNEKELKECFNYKNLQPLWRIDNIKKSNIY